MIYCRWGKPRKTELLEAFGRPKAFKNVSRNLPDSDTRGLGQV